MFHLLQLKIDALKMRQIIIVHGGAGDIPQSRVKGKLDGTKAAVIAGHRVLESGGSALEAVEAAVVSMELDESFNAGTLYEILINSNTSFNSASFVLIKRKVLTPFLTGYGSVLNLRGEVEMEASIMCGKNLDVGAVTLIKDFLHPISIAHKILVDSPHSLLGGEGAKIFALEKVIKE